MTAARTFKIGTTLFRLIRSIRSTIFASIHVLCLTPTTSIFDHVMIRQDSGRHHEDIIGDNQGDRELYL